MARIAFQHSFGPHYAEIGTFGIDTQIPWPAQERIVCFRGRKFHLLPGSGAPAR